MSDFRKPYSRAGGGAGDGVLSVPKKGPIEPLMVAAPISQYPIKKGPQPRGLGFSARYARAREAGADG